MITNTNDIDLILQAFNDAGETAIDIESFVAQNKNVVLLDERGIMLFKYEAPNLYTTSIYTNKNNTGVDTKSFINDGFEWMLLNTDAFLLRGYVSKNNKPLIAMVAPTNGAYRLSESSQFQLYVYAVSLARWALAIGIDVALTKLRDNLQEEKAKKLEDAWTEFQENK
jgi:hypothetical protein